MMPPASPARASHEAAIRADKIRLIHNNTPLMLAGNLFGCIPLTVILLEADYGPGPLIWAGAIYLLTLLRGWHYLRLPANADRQRIFRQGRDYLVFSLISGCIWGSAGVFFFKPEEVAQFTFLFLTLFAMISGSMTALSARPLNYVAYALPSMLPICTNLFLQESLFYRWMGIASLVYLTLTLVMSRNMHKAISHSLMLKYQNMDLLDDLKQQTEAAQRANLDKSRFLAAASHDLRQPLHAVNLFVEALGAKLTTEAQARDMVRIRRGLDSLGELFDALLDISRMDTGSIPVRKLDFRIGPLLHKLADAYGLEARRKGLDLHVTSCGLVVRSDPVLLERMLRNLLSNAIRYTTKGEIRLICTPHGDHLIIEVRDTGPGIPSQSQDDVFTEFFQLDNPERNRGKGLGLGLAIVRRLSVLLDHPVRLESTPGQGAVFSLRVPIGDARAIPADISQSARSENRLAGKQILVIDNEADILEGMRGLLEDWQCRFVGAESAASALRLVEDGLCPDCIVSDYRLPGKLDGCALIARLREHTGTIPALLISGDTSAAIYHQAQAAGLVFLAKPIKPAQLRVAMMQELRAHERKKTD